MSGMESLNSALDKVVSSSLDKVLPYLTSVQVPVDPQTGNVPSDFILTKLIGTQCESFLLRLELLAIRTLVTSKLFGHAVPEDEDVQQSLDLVSDALEEFVASFTSQMDAAKKEQQSRIVLPKSSQMPFK